MERGSLIRLIRQVLDGRGNAAEELFVMTKIDPKILLAVALTTKKVDF